MIKSIAIIILILGFVGVIVFLDIPGIQDVLRLRKDIETQKEVFSEKQDLFAKIDEIGEDYETNKEDIQKVDFILPLESDVPNLIVQLEALALEGGLVMEQMEIVIPEGKEDSKAGKIRGQEVSSEDYNAVTINLKLTSDYPTLTAYLAAIEENIRLMDVLYISLSPQSGVVSQFFNLELGLKVYYQK